MPWTELLADRPGERVLARICGYCRDPFDATREHQRYCRPRCRIAAFKAKREIASRPADPTLFD